MIHFYSYMAPRCQKFSFEIAKPVFIIIWAKNIDWNINFEFFVKNVEMKKSIFWRELKNTSISGGPFSSSMFLMHPLVGLVFTFSFK